MINFQTKFTWIKNLWMIFILTIISSSFFLLGREFFDKEKYPSFFKKYFSFIFLISIIFFGINAIIIGAFEVKLNTNEIPFYNKMMTILLYELKNLKYLIIALSSLLVINLLLKNKEYFILIPLLIFIACLLTLDFVLIKVIGINLDKILVKEISILAAVLLFFTSTFTIDLIVNKENKELLKEKINFAFLKNDFKTLLWNFLFFALTIICFNLLIDKSFAEKTIALAIKELIVLFNVLIFLPLIILLWKDTALKHYNSLKENIFGYIIVFVFAWLTSIGMIFIKFDQLKQIFTNNFILSLIIFLSINLVFLIGLLTSVFLLTNNKIKILLIQTFFLTVVAICTFIYTLNAQILSYSNYYLTLFLFITWFLYSLISCISFVAFVKKYKIKILNNRNNELKFLVIGNINSGKSLYAQKLKELLDLEIISIDNFREKYGSFKKDNEKIVFKKFVKKILNTPQCIVEFSGLEKYSKLLLTRLDPISTFVFYVKTPLQKCIDTLIAEKYEEIPYLNFSENNLLASMQKYSQDEQSNLINNTWFSYSNLIFPITSINDFENIPLNKILAFNYIRHRLDNLYIDSAFLVGSMANGNFNKYSDINIAIVSPISSISLRNLLSNDSKIDAILKRNNIVSLIIDDTLFDLILFKNLEDAHEVIFKTKIKEFNKIALINAPNLKTIKKLSKTNLVDEIELYLNLIGETDYLSSNLTKIASRGDKYIFYLTTLKLVQNIVRLNALIDGQNDFNFLPEHAIKYINNPKIVYSLNLSMTHYIEDFTTYWKENKGKYYVHFQKAITNKKAK
ncbi:nucleotidyltransferase domain-containing protein [Mycoplasmopsis hyopharyngis]|uniref:nucleotidyltransferase domain-containing protein n=1 Tax=Mycoplasmopsis hyopharyngis TaxID=29558 RepID=UPI00387348B2